MSKTQSSRVFCRVLWPQSYDEAPILPEPIRSTVSFLAFEQIFLCQETDKFESLTIMLHLFSLHFRTDIKGLHFQIKHPKILQTWMYFARSFGSQACQNVDWGVLCHEYPLHTRGNDWLIPVHSTSTVSFLHYLENKCILSVTNLQVVFKHLLLPFNICFLCNCPLLYKVGQKCGIYLVVLKYWDNNNIGSQLCMSVIFGIVAFVLYI